MLRKKTRDLTQDQSKTGNILSRIKLIGLNILCTEYYCIVALLLIVSCLLRLHYHIKTSSIELVKVYDLTDSRLLFLGGLGWKTEQQVVEEKYWPECGPWGPKAMASVIKPTPHATFAYKPPLSSFVQRPVRKASYLLCATNLLKKC